MFRALLSAVVLLLVAVPRVAEACSCARMSSCQRFALAQAVFVAEVIDVTEGTTGPKRSRMRVVRAYKGTAKPAEEVIVLMPRGSSASCSLDVKAGDRYVIHAAAGPDGFSTGLCMGSYGLKKGDPLPELPPPGGVVTGKLVRYGSSNGGKFEPQPIAGAPVWVVTADGRVDAKTDADGDFRLAGVPSGSWTVRFDVGQTERSEEKIVLRSADDCAEVYASPRPAGRLIGSVVDHAGKPIPGARISVAKADAASPFSLRAETGPSGAFSITGLPAGTYHVVVGPSEAPTATFPFARLFHPGVLDRVAATPVVIGTDTVSLPAIRMRAPVPLTSIVDEIVCRDGSRPASAYLTAQRLPARDAFGPREFGSSEPKGTLYAVRVVRGHRYAVRGEVTVKEPRPGGGFGTYPLSTMPVDVDADAPPPRLVLRSELEKCGEAGGVTVPARR